MRSKAPLVMMEQLVMVLVFALTAALCVQMFVLAERLSGKYEATDRAVLEAQNTAENLKALGPKEGIKVLGAEQSSPELWVLCFTSDWEVTEVEGEFYMEISLEETGWMWKAEIAVFMKDGTELFRIPVSGQTEVKEHAES